MHARIKINNQSAVFFVAGLLSCLLSVWMSVREYVINPDAICYLLSAAEMRAGLHAAMHLCSQAEWPFYSGLIYIFGSITQLSYTVVAYVLDGIFSLVTVLTFIAIIRFITQNSRIIWFAALVILFAHEFNSVRQYIVRDHGFWAFYLLSVYFLLAFFRYYQWRYAVAWSMSLVIATLFRVEGAIFLLALPYLSFFQGQQSLSLRIKSFFQLNTIMLLGITLVVIALLTQVKVELTRLHEIQFQLLHGIQAIAQHFSSLKLTMATTILGPDAAHEAGIVLSLMLLSWYLLSVVMNLSPIYFILLVLAWAKQLMAASRSVRFVLWGYIIINVLITAGFLAEHMFLSKRYLMALSLILMLWIPFALEYLFERVRSRQWRRIALCIILVVGVGNLVDFGYSKKYLRDAGVWAAKNIPTQATFYSNDLQLMYYSDHFGNMVFAQGRDYLKANAIADKQWQQYDYLGLRVNKQDVDKMATLLKTITYRPVKVFQNKRGDQVIIYQRN